MNGGRCDHGAVSSSGEFSPKTSGTRSELSDRLSSRLLKRCELIAGVASWIGSPEAHRPGCSGREVRHEWA